MPPGPEKAEAQEAAQLGAEVVKAKSRWSLSKKNIAQAASEKQAALRKKKKAEAMPEGPEKDTAEAVAAQQIAEAGPEPANASPSHDGLSRSQVDAGVHQAEAIAAQAEVVAAQAELETQKV